jgi:hypothetical protein
VIHESYEGFLRKVKKVTTACLMSVTGQIQKVIDNHLLRIMIESEFEG